MSHPFLSEHSESIWFDKWRVDDAERTFHEELAGTKSVAVTDTNKSKDSQSKGVQSKDGQSSLVSEIAKARQQIQNSLKTDCNVLYGKMPAPGDYGAEIAKLRQDNEDLQKITSDLRQIVKNLENRIVALESAAKSAAPTKIKEEKQDSPKDEEEEEEEEELNLFGSDDDADAEADRIKQERVKAYTDKKAKKAPLIAKSSILLDVKPWDDETDMAELEKCVRTIEMDGLVWGASKLVPLAYGIKKLQIICVVEDDKISTEDLEEKICAFEDFIQSMDIAAFNKI